MEIWHMVGLAVLVLNIFISVFIARRDDLDTFQKTAQIVIVWLIPFVAAIGLWLFHRGNDDNSSGGGPFGGGPSDSVSVQASSD